jgi:hypothetical protein
MALVLISDLQSLRTIVANQTRDGADVTAFLEAWHTSVVQRLRGLPLTTDEKTSICAAVAALPWAADKQAQIVQLVHTPVSVTAAAAASTSRRALQRCEHHFEQYFDDADIEYFASTENSLVGKIGRIVRRCHLSGLQHPSEQTFARMAASLAVFGFSTTIDESSLYNLFVELKHCMRSTTIVWPFEYILQYGPPAATLTQDAFTLAYGDNGPSVHAMAHSLEVNTVFNRMPLRSSSRHLQRIQGVQLQLHQPQHSPPTRRSNTLQMQTQQPQAQHTDFASQFMQMMQMMTGQQPQGQHARPHALTDIGTVAVHGLRPASSTVATGADDAAIFELSDLSLGAAAAWHDAGREDTDERAMREALAARGEKRSADIALRRPAAAAATDDDPADEEPDDSYLFAHRRPAAAVARRPAAAVAMRRPSASVMRRPAAAVVLGCSKCRGSPGGCIQCRNPLFGGERWTR